MSATVSRQWQQKQQQQQQQHQPKLQQQLQQQRRVEGSSSIIGYARGPPSPSLPPGSHSSALQVSGGGLTLPPSSSAAPSSIIPKVGRQKGSANMAAASPRVHLWHGHETTSTKRKRGRALAEEEGNKPRPVIVPARSPVRRIEWWQRPPSPLVSHMRPLWGSSCYGSSLSSNTTSQSGTEGAAGTSAAVGAGGRAGGKASHRLSTQQAPSQSARSGGGGGGGKEGGGGGGSGGEASWKLDSASRVDSVLTPGSSAFSQDSTFFTRQYTKPKSGGWSPAAIDGAPPPPVMAAPTPSSSGAAAAAAAAALPPSRNPLKMREHRHQHQHQQQLHKQTAVLSQSSMEDSTPERKGGAGGRRRFQQRNGHDSAWIEGSDDVPLTRQRIMQRKLSCDETPRDVDSILDSIRWASGPGDLGAVSVKGDGDPGHVPSAWRGSPDGSMNRAVSDTPDPPFNRADQGSGHGDGDPAHLPPQVVTRRHDSFRKSVGKGLANAIAEMKASLGSDDSEDDDPRGGGGGRHQASSEETKEGYSAGGGGGSSVGARSQTAADDVNEGGGAGGGSAAPSEQAPGTKEHYYSHQSPGLSLISLSEGSGISEAEFELSNSSSSSDGEDLKAYGKGGGGGGVYGTDKVNSTSASKTYGSRKGDLRDPNSVVRNYRTPPIVVALPITSTANKDHQHKASSDVVEVSGPTVEAKSVGAAAAAAAAAGAAGGPHEERRVVGSGGVTGARSHAKGPLLLKLPSASSVGTAPVVPPSPTSSVVSSSVASSVASSEYSASSQASSSLATSMRIKSRRRRRGEPRVTRGTRPEREVGALSRQGSGVEGSHRGGGGNGGQQERRRAYDRGRRAPPSTKEPLKVGNGDVRVVNNRGGRVGRGGLGLPGMGNSGVLRIGMAGTGSGKGARGMGRQDLGHLTAARKEDAVEHYVNPMNAHARGNGGVNGSGSLMKGSSAQNQRGVFAKLLRKCMFLPKRWRREPEPSAKRPRDVSWNDGSTSEDRIAFLSERGGGGGLPSSTKGSTISTAKRKVVDLSNLEEELGVGKAAEYDGEELEMACRRLLDALWMSAKRGSDTLQFSVVDGRALLTGLLTGCAPPPPPSDVTAQLSSSPTEPPPLEPLVDLRIPLPKALAALTAARTAAGNYVSSSGQKPMRPVLVGASGPFARAAREEGTSYAGSVDGGSSVSSGASSRSGRSGRSSRRSGRSSSSIRRREKAALQRAMELAMGVEGKRDERLKARSDRERRRERGGPKPGDQDKIGGGGVGGGAESEGGSESGSNRHSEWVASSFRPAPSDGRVQGRHTASRARVHRELRNASESGGLSFGGGSERGSVAGRSRSGSIHDEQNLDGTAGSRPSLPSRSALVEAASRAGGGGSGAPGIRSEYSASRSSIFSNVFDDTSISGDDDDDYASSVGYGDDASSVGYGDASSVGDDGESTCSEESC